MRKKANEFKGDASYVMDGELSRGDEIGLDTHRSSSEQSARASCHVSQSDTFDICVFHLP
jgi:hypothetical protein